MSVHPSNQEDSRQISDRTVEIRSINKFGNKVLIILILAILIATVLGVTMIIYISRHDTNSKTIYIKEISAEEREKIIFNDCIDIVWENLLRYKFDQSNPDYLQQIQIKVFKTLHHLTSIYKRDLILFLYERELIRTDIPSKEQLNLHGADLNNIRFENHELDYLYLPGVIALNSRFLNCQLKKSNFKGSIMDNSHFSACSLNESTFESASLKRSSFTTDITLSNVNFNNADLFESQININRLTNENLRVNTRLSNGSFSNIDSKNLINDGGAEQQCNTSRTDDWSWTESRYSPLEIVHRNTNDSCISMEKIPNNNCFFQAKSTSGLIQVIDLTHYSTLIDNNQAGYHISAYLGCTNTSSTEQATVEIHFANERKIYENVSANVLKAGESWKLYSDSSSIPIGMRAVQILITTIMGQSSICCAIDDVNLNIFEKPLIMFN